MLVAQGQQYNIGERPTVVLYTYTNRHVGTPKPGSSRSPNLIKGINVEFWWCTAVLVRSSSGGDICSTPSKPSSTSVYELDILPWKHINYHGEGPQAIYFGADLDPRRPYHKTSGLENSALPCPRQAAEEQHYKGRRIP